MTSTQADDEGKALVADQGDVKKFVEMIDSQLVLNAETGKYVLPKDKKQMLMCSDLTQQLADMNSHCFRLFADMLHLTKEVIQDSARAYAVEELVLALLRVIQSQKYNNNEKKMRERFICPDEVKSFVQNNVIDRLPKNLQVSAIISFDIGLSRSQSLNLIHELVAAQDYVSASRVAVHFKLQKSLKLEAIVLPLIQRKQLEFVVSYLPGCTPEDQQTIIRSFAAPGKVKQGVKMLKRCGYQFSDFPEIVSQLKKNAIFFLIKKSKVCDFCHDLIDPKEDQEIIDFMFVQLRKYEMWNEYAELAPVYGVEFSADFSHRHVGSEQMKMASDEYLEMKNEIIWVNDAETTKLARSLLLDPSVRMIGFDAEMFPSVVSQELSEVGKNPNSRTLAIIQFGLRDKAIIFDVHSAYDDLKDEWTQILQEIFSSSVLKIGYGLEHDSRVLRKDIGIKIGGFVHDYREIEAKISEAYSASIENSKTTKSASEAQQKFKHRGLSNLCKTVLGKPLDKSEQISNWFRRPLRQAQLTYAGLDACCLVGIFDKLEAENPELIQELAHSQPVQDDDDDDGNGAIEVDADNDEDVLMNLGPMNST
eukprot:TRINITY_DN5460_c0_g2_i1.p1 TRINITY_DN5460_c0_g2~~TRINITY_DN5460_c0_g2_i1.p1  ORF type:complete len:591 (-),score=144.73 TRINITY_DN5460_c0_g2_i1:464-2236(-)